VYFSLRPRSAIPAAPAAKFEDWPSLQLLAELAAVVAQEVGDGRRTALLDVLLGNHLNLH
jgi:hypothetical protein